MSQYEIKHEILGRPDYAMIKLSLEENQMANVEPSAMAAMDSNIRMKTKAKGGIIKGIKRKLTGESFFMNEFTAKKGPGELFISPALPGDTEHIYLEDSNIILQGSAFVASSEGVTIDSKFQGLKGLFNGEGFFLIQAKGIGDLFFNTYGSMIEIPVDGNYVVDNGYIVAFEDTLQYHTEVVGGLKFGVTTLMSGEGIVCRFEGHGRLWIQSRQLGPFVGWASTFGTGKKGLVGSVLDNV
ncbi:MAG: TIGR00266 family protein [Planctomycetota bacterium]|nr:MAG: TIGR00266 family protein [Planctomycetota bacterium]